MNFSEKTIDSKQIYKGRIINVKIDTVVLPDGSRASRELVEHPGGVGIIAVDENRDVLMVEQFRKPFEQMVLEVPAGKLDAGEEPLECGKRELKEETGCTAEEYTYLGTYYATPGFCSEKLSIYLATKLHQARQQLDDGEFLEVRKMSLDTLYDMVMNNEIHDAKTAIAILKTKQILG